MVVVMVPDAWFGSGVLDSKVMENLLVEKTRLSEAAGLRS